MGVEPMDKALMCQSLPSCPRYFAHLPLATTAGEVVEDKIPWRSSCVAREEAAATGLG